MPSSAKDNPSTAYKPDVVPSGLAPATVIRPGRAAELSDREVQSGEVNSSTIGNHLFPENGRDVHANLPSGTKLGPYVVEQRIGAGGMGAVFRAQDESLDRTVALKILAPGQTHDPSAVKRFQNEARSAARLDHENIARIYSVGESHHLHYIAFEFVEGKTVRELIREQTVLDSDETINFVLQIALALKHTSASGVVHRDIKPSNLIMMPNGRAKLVDWGLARKERLENQSLDLTVSGTTLGTFDYISPEQARDPRKVDVRSDLYSLGCTAYHMLTGSPPYAEGTVLQKLLDHQGKPAPDCREKNPTVPVELAKIIKKMMASNPEDRYQTPQSLIHELLALASDSGLRPVHPDGLTWQNSRTTSGNPSHNLNWWWLGAFVVACSVAIISDYLLPPKENSLPSNKFSQQVTEPNTLELPAADASSDFLNDAPLSDHVLGLAPKSPFDNVFNPSSVAPYNGFSVPSNIVQPLTNDWLSKPKETSDSWGSQNHDKVLGKNDSPENEAGSIRLGIEDNLMATEDSSPSMNPKDSQISSADEANFRILVGDNELLRSADLETALTTVPDGGVIEYAPKQAGTLIYSARQLRLLDKSITLRAAVKSRLVLQFNTDKTGTSLRSRDLILIKNGSLTTSNVDIQVAVPNAISHPWSLFTIEGPGKLRCRKSTVTIEGKHKQTASIVRLMNSSLQTIEAMTPEGTAQKVRGQIEFEECFLRGTADLLSAETSASAALEIRQSLVTIDGALIRYTGDNNVRSLPEEWNIRLSRVAAVINDGLLRVDLGTTMPKQAVDMRVRADDCLFIGQRDQPLIQLTGGQEMEELQKTFWWVAENNLYAGWNHRMVVQGPASLGSLPKTIEFDNSPLNNAYHEERRPKVLTRPDDFNAPVLRIDRWDASQLLQLLELYREQNPDSTEIDFSVYGPDYSDLPGTLPTKNSLPN